MTRSLGQIASGHVLDVRKELHLRPDAELNTSRVAGTGKVTLKDGTHRRVEILDGTSSPSFSVWQAGTLYTKSKLLPNYTDNPSPSGCSVGEPAHFWQGVYANAYHFPDGTQQTTAAAPSSLTQTHENNQIATASWTENPIFTDATKHYKVILRNVRSQGLGRLDLNFYSSTGNIIAGEFSAVN